MNYVNKLSLHLVVVSAGFIFSLAGILSSGPAVLADKIIIEKKAHRLTVYSGPEKIKVFRIALGRGGTGRKLRRGDSLTPEGKYRINGRNPQSKYHRSLRVSYPNKEDEARASASGADPGGDIMIHGVKNGFGWLGPLHRLFDWTSGCVALTNGEIEELWELAPDGTEVEILP